MYVIEYLSINRLPIYTIHDNFVSTPEISRYMNKIYLDKFLELGPPIQHIMSFIYLNIVKPVDRLGMTPINHVYTEDELQNYANMSKPKQLNNREKKMWDKKISAFLSHYKEYVKSVCEIPKSSEDDVNRWWALSKDVDLWALHEEKWESFRNKIVESKPLHCVHY